MVDPLVLNLLESVVKHPEQPYSHGPFSAREIPLSCMHFFAQEEEEDYRLMISGLSKIVRLLHHVSSHSFYTLHRHTTWRRE